MFTADMLRTRLLPASSAPLRLSKTRNNNFFWSWCAAADGELKKAGDELRLTSRQRPAAALLLSPVTMGYLLASSVAYIIRAYMQTESQLLLDLSSSEDSGSVK